MQPVFPYQAETYPPRGQIWPQFGDDVLEETLSLSEGARQSLSKKRQGMSDFHTENLQYHGLAPRPTAEETPLPPDGRDVPVPMDDDDVQMTVPSSQPPPPPQGPNRRFPQNRLQRPPAQGTVDGPSFPGLPPGPGGPPGRFPYTSRVPLDADVDMVNRYNIGEDDAVTVQGGLGKPPDFPGSGAAALRNREYFRTPQTGPGGLPDVANPLSSGGGPPPPPAAGAVLIPHYAAGPDPAEMYYPPGDAPGPAFPGARIRATPYDQPPRKRIVGKQPSLRDEFFAEGMDTAPSAPAAITPMEEQNTGVKRGKEESKKKSKKKKEEVAAQSPPSLPPPPPGGAAALKAPREVAEPDVEPASGSATNAPTSVPHYRPKGGRKAAPDIDDLPSVPTKRGAEKPLEDGTPAVLRPEAQRRRAPAPEPDSEPSPLNPSSSSSSRRLAVGNQKLW
jgi:hypothetical protein